VYISALSQKGIMSRKSPSAFFIDEIIDEQAGKIKLSM
jgi:hypothetical protein